MSPYAFLEHLSKARWRAWMYPEGAHELETKFELEFGAAAMGVAFAYLCQKVQFSYKNFRLSRWSSPVVLCRFLTSNE